MLNYFAIAVLCMQIDLILRLRPLYSRSFFDNHSHDGWMGYTRLATTLCDLGALVMCLQTRREIVLEC